MKKNVLLASLGVAAMVSVACGSTKPAEKPADPAAAPATAAPADAAKPADPAAKPAEGSCGADKKGAEHPKG